MYIHYLVKEIIFNLNYFNFLLKNSVRENHLEKKVQTIFKIVLSTTFNENVMLYSISNYKFI